MNEPSKCECNCPLDDDVQGPQHLSDCPMFAPIQCSAPSPAVVNAETPRRFGEYERTTTGLTWAPGVNGITTNIVEPSTQKPIASEPLPSTFGKAIDDLFNAVCSVSRENYELKEQLKDVREQNVKLSAEIAEYVRTLGGKP